MTNTALELHRRKSLLDHGIRSCLNTSLSEHELVSVVADGNAHNFPSTWTTKYCYPWHVETLGSVFHCVLRTIDEFADVRNSRLEHNFLLLTFRRSIGFPRGQVNALSRRATQILPTVIDPVFWQSDVCFYPFKARPPFASFSGERNRGYHRFPQKREIEWSVVSAETRQTVFAEPSQSLVLCFETWPPVQRLQSLNIGALWEHWIPPTCQGEQKKKLFRMLLWLPSIRAISG